LICLDLSLAGKKQTSMNKFAIDTNILIYSHDENAVEKQNLFGRSKKCGKLSFIKYELQTLTFVNLEFFIRRNNRDLV
jgi:hypothetical protein